MATKSLRRAVAIMVGSIVGAGVLGLPYVFAQSGYLIGLVTLLVVGIAILMEFMIVGELALETPGRHQIVGLAKRYLGEKGKWLMQIIVLLSIWGAMLAYTVGSGDVFSSFFAQNAVYGVPLKIIFSLIFLFTLSIPIYLGLKATADVETPLVVFFIGLIIAMCALAITQIDLANLQTVNLAKSLLPYGVVLFAISGSMVIPEAKIAVSGDSKLLRTAVLLGGIIPLLLYLFFTTVVVGVVGDKASEVATIAFGQLTNPIIIVLGNIFALVAMATSFMVLGLVLKDTFIQDIGMKNNQAYLLTISFPLIMMFFAKSFAQILEITGAFLIGLGGILIGIMALKARKYKAVKHIAIKNTPAPYIVITMFVIGIVLTAAQLLGLGPF